MSHDQIVRKPLGARERSNRTIDQRLYLRFEVWAEEVHVKPLELIDLGESIVVLADVPMRAQASGVPLTEAFAIVSTLKDGMVIRHQEYFDHVEALEAVGLRE
jgi:ketosteroid isomerase-like protein